MNIIQKDTPNFSKGRQGNEPEVVVVHWIVGTLEAADATFANSASQVSAHYGIGDDEVHQYVKEEDTAWHCGDWLWNLKSIGIEHEGSPDLPISEKTYKASAELIKGICVRYNIPVDKEHILPHKHFKATQCPGTLDIDKIISLIKKTTWRDYFLFDITKRLSDDIFIGLNFDRMKDFDRTTALDSIYKEWDDLWSTGNKLYNDMEKMKEAHDNMKIAKDKAEKSLSDLQTRYDKLKAENSVMSLPLALEVLARSIADYLKGVYDKWLAEQD